MGLNVLVVENDESSFRTIRHALSNDSDLHACTLTRVAEGHPLSSASDIDLAILRQRLCAGMQRHHAKRLGITRKTQVVLVCEGEAGSVSFGEVAARVNTPIVESDLTAALGLAKAALIGRRMQDLWRLLGGYAKFLREGDKLSNDLPCAPQAIEWIESKANYVVIHTASAQYTVRMTMAAAEERLKSTDIIRIHRRCMVNRSKIKQVLQDSGGEFVLTVTGQRLRIGRAFRKILFDATIEQLHTIKNLLTPAFT